MGNMHVSFQSKAAMRTDSVSHQTGTRKTVLNSLILQTSFLCVFVLQAQNEDFEFFPGRVMFYLRWPGSTMNFTWRKLHPTTSSSLSSLVSRALMLQPGDVTPFTASPDTRADSRCSQAYPLSLLTTTGTEPVLKHCHKDYPRRQICCISSPSQYFPPKPPHTQAVWRYTAVSTEWADLEKHLICCNASGGHR